MVRIQAMRDKQAEERQKQRKGAKQYAKPKDPNRPSKGSLKNKHSIDAELERLGVASTEAIRNSTNLQVIKASIQLYLLQS